MGRLILPATQQGRSIALALTNTTNIASSLWVEHMWRRNLDQVLGWGVVQFTPTATGVCVLNMAPPIASNFSSFSDGAGMGFDSSAVLAVINANGTTDTLELTYTAASTSAKNIRFNYNYRIL